MNRNILSAIEMISFAMFTNATTFGLVSYHLSHRSGSIYIMSSLLLLFTFLLCIFTKFKNPNTESRSPGMAVIL